MRALLPLFILVIIISYACTDTQNQRNAKSKTDEKIEFYQDKIESDPKAYSYYNTLAQAYIQKARETGDHNYYHKAELSLKQSLLISPQNYIGLVYTAVLHASEHNFNEALKYAKLAVNHYPDKSHAYGVLGDAYLELRQLQNAEKSYIKMVQLKPDLDSLSRISILKYSTGDIEGAVHAMEKAYEKGLKDVRTSRENLAWTQVILGSIHLSTGDNHIARSYFQKALEIMPEYFLASEHSEQTHTHTF